MGMYRQENKKQYKNGLVLSGGAYRGMGQVGVLKALLERGIEPDAICGTSAGALNAALYANGYSPDEIYEMWKREPFGKLVNLQLPRFGLLRNENLGKLLKSYLRYDRLEETPLPVFIATACLNTGEQVVFRQGDLAQLLEASCAVPGIFEPIDIAGRLYVDGGLVSNLPVEPLEGKCERLIGVSVNPIPLKEKLDGLKDILYRSMWSGLEGTVKKTSRLCDWFIEPEELGRHGLMERSALDLFFTAGYEYTSAFLDERGLNEPFM